MELGHSDGKLEVQYDERLVKLIREVRQLQGMGYAVPAKIQNTATNAMKFYRQAVVLKQVCVFIYMIQVVIITVNYRLRFNIVWV